MNLIDTRRNDTSGSMDTKIIIDIASDAEEKFRHYGSAIIHAMSISRIVDIKLLMMVLLKEFEQFKGQMQLIINGQRYPHHHRL